ncbi:MAG: uL15 family ribosomal protein [Candidatus Aenigmarchaeota archaeon]|nr:uL15 family ribosomal protein [Candidatus Aenigmarchaeota archaeon]
MTTNRTKKVRKLRGSRTYGWGHPKKHRGAGSRGGVGNAGRGKKGQQRMSWVNKYGTRIGSVGFKIPVAVKLIPTTINLSEIEKNLDNYINDKLATKENGKILIDATKLGYDKVLGSGKLTTSIVIKAKSFSKKAEEKIKKAKGEIQVI